MSNKDKVVGESQEGVDIKKVTFDENGEVVGLDDDVLADIAGGRISDSEGNNVACDEKC